MRKARPYLYVFFLGAVVVWFGNEFPRTRIKFNSRTLWIHEQGIFHIAWTPPAIALKRGRIISAKLENDIVEVVATSDAQVEGWPETRSRRRLNGVEIRVTRLSSP